jgi:proline dehydrogenase
MYIPIINRFTVFPSQLPKTIQNLKGRGIKPIIDYSVESKGNSFKSFYEIQEKQKLFPNNTFAIKPSGIMNSDKNLTNKIFDQIAMTAKNESNNILIDAENVDIQNDINDFTDRLIQKFNKDNGFIYKTYQMYRKDSLELLKKDIDYSIKNDYKLSIKLVRGAYHIQDLSSGLLFDDIIDTHKSYNEGIKLIFDSFDLEYNSVIWATHNNESIELVKKLTDKKGYKRENIKIAQLLGMSDNITNSCLEEGYNVMKYVPYGPITETIPYLLRRLNENKYMIKYVL